MTDTVIPLTQNANQSANVILSGTNCVINVYQKGANLFFDLISSGTVLIAGRLCLDRVQLIFEDYLPIQGQLFFADMQGTQNPTYDQLNIRYFLFYRT